MRAGSLLSLRSNATMMRAVSETLVENRTPNPEW